MYNQHPSNIDASAINIYNPCLNTDSYKLSHFLQLPPDQTETFSYVSSRGGKYDVIIPCGPQPYLMQYLSVPIKQSDVEEARIIADLHGVPFNYAGFTAMVEKKGGMWPVEIEASPEGLPIPTHHVIVTIRSTDPEFAWVVGFLETGLLRAVWYMTTVATQSWHIRHLIEEYANRTCDTLDGIEYKLNDFSARGVSSFESAGLGGIGHLLSFCGTDNLAAILFAMRFYQAGVIGRSVPAAEHSTITVYGREGEADAYRQLLRQFAKPGAIVAIVSDSYDIKNAICNIWGVQLRQEVIDSEALVVIRPDSGDPVSIVAQSLVDLEAAYGSVTNSKGYRVLNHVRVIQGDGVNIDTIRKILETITSLGFSVDNIAFGMGGALLQIVNRDDQRFAMKCSAVHLTFCGWVDVYKDPVTDPGKQSKRGQLTLMRLPNADDPLGWQYATIRIEQQSEFESKGWAKVLRPVFRDGQILAYTTIDEMRRNCGW